MSRRIAWLAGLAAVVAFAAVAQPAGEADGQATEATQRWLKLMDGGNYGEAWDAASIRFRNNVPRTVWIEQAAKTRGPLGAVTSHQAQRRSVERNPPGAPPGEYVRIEFETGFAEWPAARSEAVSLIREGAEGWRVVGYFLR
jgi:hypothetical protein